MVHLCVREWFFSCARARMNYFDLWALSAPPSDPLGPLIFFMLSRLAAPNLYLLGRCSPKNWGENANIKKLDPHPRGNPGRFTLQFFMLFSGLNLRRLGFSRFLFLGWAIPPSTAGTFWKIFLKIPERPRKRSQSISWNSPREYGWDPQKTYNNNSRCLRLPGSLPDHFQNSLPLSTAGMPLFQK